MTRVRNIRRVGVLALALGLTASAAAGRQPPLDLETAKQKVAEQKVERELADVLVAADQQLRFNNRAKAADLIKDAKRNLQFAPISEAARTRLTATLDGKIAALEGRAVGGANPGAGVKLDPRGAEATAAQKAAAEKAAAEFKDVVEGLKAVQKAEDAGNTTAANAEITRLTKLYPDNPSVQALGQAGNIRTKINDAGALAVEMRNRWVKDQQGIMRSAMPAIMDMEFPANWKELSARRLKPVEMTAKEKRIIEALDKPVSVNFRERPFQEALQELSNMLDHPLLLDKKSLQDLEIDLNKGTTLEAKGLSGRSVLRSVLAAQGLTFVVKDETIQITTVERARNLLTTKVYYLGDLVRGTGPFGGPEWGPFLNAEQTAENARLIVGMITKSIDPLSWRDNGGPGTVTFHAPTGSIIVRASSEVHFTLGRSFGSGR